jgi:hypothetical protein
VAQPLDGAGARRLYVPLRDGAGGVSVSLRLFREFRDRAESRCAVGFTTVERLENVLGTGHRQYRMTERAVRTLARTRGVSTLIVDPHCASFIELCDQAAEWGPYQRRAALRPAWR